MAQSLDMPWPHGAARSRSRFAAMAAGAELGAAALVAILFSDALIGPIFDPRQTGDAPWLRLVWLPAYAVIFLLAAIRAPRLAAFWRAGLVLLILVGWAAASMAWTADPATTGRRALALAFTTLFGFYLAAALDGRALARLLAATFLTLALATTLVCVFLPGFGVHQHVNQGDWKGLWYEKNQMGALMSIGALSTAVSAGLTPGRGRFWLAATALCAFLVVMSRSMTDLAMLLLVLGGLAGLKIAARGPAFAVLAAWIGAVCALVVAAGALLVPDAFYRTLGKDPTLTGRTDIWSAAGHWARLSPWLGYGYSAFWTRHSPPAKWIRDQLGWMVPNAHNGWLDLRLQLGWIGLGLCAAVFVAAAIIGWLRRRRLGDGGFSILFLAAFGFATLSESVILEQNDLFWVLCVAALARILGPSPFPRPTTA